MYAQDRLGTKLEAFSDPRKLLAEIPFVRSGEEEFEKFVG